MPAGLRRRADQHPHPSSCAHLLESQAVVHCDGDLLLGPKITLRGLDRAVPQQELDLFEIPAAFSAQLGAGPAEVMGPEVLDSHLPGRLLDH